MYRASAVRPASAEDPESAMLIVGFLSKLTRQRDLAKKFWHLKTCRMFRLKIAASSLQRLDEDVEYSKKHRRDNYFRSKRMLARAVLWKAYLNQGHVQGQGICAMHFTFDSFVYVVYSSRSIDHVASIMQ
jgi:hypothetical protein